MIDRCVCCGEYVPEGYQVCLGCRTTKSKELLLAIEHRQSRKEQRLEGMRTALELVEKQIEEYKSIAPVMAIAGMMLVRDDIRQRIRELSKV